MKTRRLLPFLFSLVTISAIEFGAAGPLLLHGATPAHADGTLGLSSASGAPGTQVTVTLYNTGQCSGCYYDVRWGDPNTGPVFCTMVQWNPYNDTGYPSCSGAIPTAPQGTYMVSVVDSGCTTNCRPYDSANLTINADPPIGTNDGSIGNPSYDPNDPYPSTAAPPDPNADANSAGDGVDEATAQALAGADPPPLCSGAYYTRVANIYFRVLSGRLTWDFYLTNEAWDCLGSPATVIMPFAVVNGMAINPPYGPHTRARGYDFHSSMLTYQIIGDGTRTLRSGDIVTLFWFITGTTSEAPPQTDKT